MKQDQAAPPDVQALFDELLKAVHENSYDQLVANGDPNFQASLTPQMVKGVSAQLAPRIEIGYQAGYMGMLDRKNYVSHYWKLAFTDSKGDRLARLSLKGDKVYAFYVL